MALNTMIRFYEGKSSSFVMFPEDAIQLIKFMGHSGQIPGAILADNIRISISNLEIAINSQKEQENFSDDRDQSQENFIRLKTRAYPLLRMLKSAHTHNTYIMWDYA